MRRPVHIFFRDGQWQYDALSNAWWLNRDLASYFCGVLNGTQPPIKSIFDK